VYYWWAPGGDRQILNTGSHLLEGIPRADSSFAEDTVNLTTYPPCDSVQGRHHVDVGTVEWTTNWSYPAALRRVYRYKPLVGNSRKHWSGITQDDVGFGLQELDPGAIYPRHAHRCPEVYFILEGSAEFSVGDQNFTATPATAVLIPPDEVHRIANTARGKLRWIYFWWAPGGKKEVLDVGSHLVDTGIH